MGRTAAANDQLLLIAQENGIDIALVQEPYTNRSKLSGLEVHPYRCIVSSGNARPEVGVPHARCSDYCF